MLPWATQSGQSASFADALFTSTSAVCVTGLIVQDTATYWSEFGQFIILILIQIGGLGVVTMAVSFAVLSGRKIGLMQRSTMAEAISAHQVGGIVRLTEFILKTTFGIECLGAVVMFPVFYKEFGFIKGIWYAVFHSVSAFCNAGFDLMGIKSQFSSLTSYAGHPVINFTIMFLIIIGGIGFFVWSDIINCKGKFREFSLHSQIVIVTTVILLVTGTVGYLIFEGNGNLKGMSGGERMLSAAFMSVTSRTAGFNTMDMGSLSEAGSLLTMILMFIGGSPGSTAGGIKTTTLAAVILTAIAMAKGKTEVTVFKKRLDNGVLKHAVSIIIVYISGILLATMLICFVEPIPMEDILFETISAAGTVGVTRGITTQLGAVAKVVLMILMYGGRIGGLSLLLVFAERRTNAPTKRPSERILVG